MGVMNVLASVGMPIYSQLHSVSLNWIGKIILWLTTICGSVGVGIILFSLLLKFVTLPFDVFQRINMRKQNIKMKENQARMEKLQKQYANDKDKYNQKVMEMYRESGISIMSSCLPMILSLIIFIVAINAFNKYSSSLGEFVSSPGIKGCTTIFGQPKYFAPIILFLKHSICF